MATFEYQALTSGGRLMTGTLEAANPQQAGELLTDMKLTVNQLERKAPQRPFSTIGRNEFILFNQQLASITKAGIPLEKGLRELVSEVRSAKMRRLIEGLAEELESGHTIEQAIASRGGELPTLYRYILHAGVQSGRLSEMLTSLNRHLEMNSQTRRIIFEATCYPAVVFLLAAAIVTGVILLVIPTFTTIFVDFDVELPAITEALMSSPQYVKWFWPGLGVIVAGWWLLFRVLKMSPRGRWFAESVHLGIPILGRLYKVSILGRFADAMAVLIGAGMDLPGALRLAAAAVGSEKLINDAGLIANQIEQGAGLAEAGQTCSFLPPFFLYSAQLGIQRQELQDNLYGLSDMYTQQTQSGQSRLQAVMLPFMLVVVGGLIGFIVLGLFMPLVSLVSNMSG